jgi:hypothetical protein
MVNLGFARSTQCAVRVASAKCIRACCTSHTSAVAKTSGIAALLARVALRGVQISLHFAGLALFASGQSRGIRIGACITRCVACPLVVRNVPRRHGHTAERACNTVIRPESALRTRRTPGRVAMSAKGTDGTCGRTRCVGIMACRARITPYSLCKSAKCPRRAWSTHQRSSRSVCSRLADIVASLVCVNDHTSGGGYAAYCIARGRSVSAHGALEALALS